MQQKVDYLSVARYPVFLNIDIMFFSVVICLHLMELKWRIFSFCSFYHSFIGVHRLIQYFRNGNQFVPVALESSISSQENLLLSNKTPTRISASLVPSLHGL